MLTSFNPPIEIADRGFQAAIIYLQWGLNHHHTVASWLVNLQGYGITTKIIHTPGSAVRLQLL